MNTGHLISRLAMLSLVVGFYIVTGGQYHCGKPARRKKPSRRRAK